MEIEVLTLCDNAQEYQGKLIVVGTFSGISSKKFPFKHPTFSLACRFRYSPNEIGEKKFTFSLKNSTGKEVIPRLEAKYNVPEGITEDHPINIVLGFNNLNFEHPGTYNFEIISDDFQRTIPLYIKSLI